MSYNQANKKPVNLNEITKTLRFFHLRINVLELRFVVQHPVPGTDCKLAVLRDSPFCFRLTFCEPLYANFQGLGCAPRDRVLMTYTIIINIISIN